MKFTQKEIVELQKISCDLCVPMSFKIDGDTIDYDFSNDKSIHSILRKTDRRNYQINAINSDGTKYDRNNDDFNQFKSFITQWIKKIKHDNPFEISRRKNIDELSPKFYSTFQEATIIDNLGYHESAGMIYRKALEFVMKDFFTFQFPSYREFILTKMINQILKSFYIIENDIILPKDKSDFKEIKTELEETCKLVKVISNTFKIGNDFSHYERRLLDYSSANMKERITTIVEYIDNLISEKTLRKNRDLIGEGFDNEHLL